MVGRVGQLLLFCAWCAGSLAAIINPADVDFNGDRLIDGADAAVFWQAWLSHGGPSEDWQPACDISQPRDGVIDMLDLAKLAGDWLIAIPEPNAFRCPADINHDRVINSQDFERLAQAWQTNTGSDGWDPACDLSIPLDGMIDTLDLVVLAAHWLDVVPDPNAYDDVADLNRDRRVDWQDYAVFSTAWLTDDRPPANWDPACDAALPADGRVDQADFAALAVHWQFRIPDPNQFMFIPGGRFEMGDHHDSMFEAKPVHTVAVESFYMAKYPVTNEQYCLFLNESIDAERLKVHDGLVYAADDTANSIPYFGTNAVNDHSRIAYTDAHFTVIDKHDHPLVQVNWYGAAAYCNWLSRRQGRPPCYDMAAWECDFTVRGFRLATEAEWEYAARGGHQAPYYRYFWGDAIDGSCANYYRSGSPFASTSPVGYFNGTQIPEGRDMGNGYGLYDMAGNVLEWCSDWYDAGYYKVSPVNNPRGPATGTARVLRGGSWNNSEKYCRVSYRDSFHNPLDRSGSYGFRVCLPVPADD